MTSPSYRQRPAYLENIGMIGISLVGAAVLLRLVYRVIFH
jgi:hypothetical protein